jgi:hypothetical protein
MTLRVGRIPALESVRIRKQESGEHAGLSKIEQGQPLWI